MTAFQDVLQNIIFHGAGPYNRILVVSAYSNVTNWLLENKKTGAPGVYHHISQHQEFHQALEDVLGKLKALNQHYVPLGLDLAAADAFLEGRIALARAYLDSLVSVLASGYVNGASILQAAREILASIGEAHSAFNSVNILQNKGVNATLVDLSGFDDPRALTIDERIRQAFAGINFASTICIATGYTKGTEGIMREFDRGYSEVTFSKIAVAVKPQEAIIHKEYHLCSADPNLVGISNCHPVGFTNYDVADQLADVGMEAIHPKASKPLEINAIDLRIKNTFEPEHPGTLITRDYVSPEQRVEVITGTERVSIIDIYDPLMVGAAGFDLHLMQAFSDLGVSYIFKARYAGQAPLELRNFTGQGAVAEVRLYESRGQALLAAECVAEISDGDLRRELHRLTAGFCGGTLNLGETVSVRIEPRWDCPSMEAVRQLRGLRAALARAHGESFIAPEWEAPRLQDRLADVSAKLVRALDVTEEAVAA